MIKSGDIVEIKHRIVPAAPNAFVSRIETRPEWQVYNDMDNDTKMD